MRIYILLSLLILIGGCSGCALRQYRQEVAEMFDVDLSVDFVTTTPTGEKINYDLIDLDNIDDYFLVPEKIFKKEE